MASSKYNIDYQLPPIEEQGYLFQHRFFTQNLLEFEQGSARQVYILYRLLLYLLIIYRNVFNAYDIDITKSKKSRQNSIATISIIITKIILKFQSKKRLKKGLIYKVFIYA